jgi:hypothetical protein
MIPATSCSDPTCLLHAWTRGGACAAGAVGNSGAEPAWPCHGRGRQWLRLLQARAGRGECGRSCGQGRAELARRGWTEAEAARPSRGRGRVGEGGVVRLVSAERSWVRKIQLSARERWVR